MFVLFAVEILGPWGPEAMSLYKDLAKRLFDSLGDQRAGSYFGKRIRMAIQRGNIASLLGTFPIDFNDLGSVFYL